MMPVPLERDPDGAWRVTPSEPEQERPRTRSDCVDGPRPCPWVGCRHNLFLDVNADTGSIKLTFPELEPWDLVQTCALDLAEQGQSTLDIIGDLLNVTRERVRQVEAIAIRKVKRACKDMGDE